MATQNVIDIQRSKTLNGLRVEDVEGAINALKENPALAKFKFRLSNRWIGGGHNRSTVGNFFGLNQENSHKSKFKLDADEPALLAGTDLGANPVEHLLNALAGCLTSALVYHAALRNIRIEELESELEGDIDIRGLLGITDEVRTGYENIRVKFRVKTDADNIEELKAFSKFSPVFDVTTKGTNVDVQIERK